MASERFRLGDALLAASVLTEEQLQAALAIQRETKERLGAILVRQGFITEADLLKFLSHQKEAQVWSLAENPPSEEALSLIPLEMCKELGVVPVALMGDELMVAMVDPEDVAAIDAIRRRALVRVQPVLLSERDLRHFLRDRSADEHDAIVDEFVSQALEIVQEHHDRFSDEQAITEEETAPVISLVNQILSEAISHGASDIHVEPRSDRVEVRYRLDGLLHLRSEFPLKLLAMVVARIKIMAELDIVESRQPQDGRFTARLPGHTVDVRVSVLPNIHGQRVVMRLLDASVGRKPLDELGFSDHNFALFDRMITKPYGLVLVTGPTGSGKTTTLYAAIERLRSTSKNIMTCEDPVEYDIDGINQSQINEKIGLTFAKQLRAVLRQDPDVVLVGEIRDPETLQTALRASMTGHLVLTTLHCNDALAAFPRLFDMGGEPYLLSTSLLGVTSQRLLRVLCPHCKEETQVSDLERRLFENYLPGLHVESVYKPVGCRRCLETGYKGRTGVHEVVYVTPELATLIAGKAHIETLRGEAARLGYRSIQADALDRVAAGVTSADEARRVVSFETHTGSASVPNQQEAA